MKWIKTLKTTEMITIIGIGLTFLTGIINFIFNVYNSRKTTYINTITSKRVEWIYKLREYISTYISLVSPSQHKYLHGSGIGRSGYLDEIEKVNSQIKLHLNFLGDVDGKIIKIVNEIRDSIYGLYEILAVFDEEGYIVIKDKKFDIDDVSNNTLNENHELVALLNSKVKELNIIDDKLNKNIEDLIMHTQIYLKLEWNRVKKEARKGKYGKRQIRKEKKELYEAYSTLWESKSQ